MTKKNVASSYFAEDLYTCLFFFLEDVTCQNGDIFFVGIQGLGTCDSLAERFRVTWDSMYEERSGAF